MAQVPFLGSSIVRPLTSSSELSYSDTSNSANKLTPQSSISELSDDGVSSSESESSYDSSTSEKAEPTVQIVSLGDAFVLSNSQLKVTVKDGCITSLIDNSPGIPREVIPAGLKANQFVIFDDKPLNWQAWDVEVYHLNTREELSSGTTKVIESSPHRVSVVSETRVSKQSWIKTTISLSPVYDGQPSCVEFECEVEWRESMKFLKVEFPVDVFSKEANYETQFGIMSRPTHYNTT